MLYHAWLPVAEHFNTPKPWAALYRVVCVQFEQ